ncbi:MAG TPA: ABC transporter substrate-binding protein, partial [Acidimicrobiales bacterium]|nr:ABC transporter substrate-binding protein [Acidimicrobiales bacterium]
TTLPAGGNGGATDVGVTATSISVGNVSDLGGPVPGLFQGGPYGAQAYFDYINQTQGGVFGRKLTLTASDDGLQCNQNEADYQNLVNTVFAFVGSWSLDDNCGAQILAQGHTDVPLVQQALNPQMASLPSEYSVAPFAYGSNTGPLVYFKSKFPAAVASVGTLVGNQPAAVAAWKGQAAAMSSVGYKIVYEDDFPPAQSNFTADVVRMRSNNPPVKEVFLQSVNAPDAAIFAQEASQQNWKPELWDCPVCYFGGYINQSGGSSAVEGQFLSVTQELFLGEDASTVPEVALFDKWIKQAYPNFQPDQFASTSWADAALFVQALKSVGPHVTRKALLAALAGIHQFSDNGLFPVTDVGGKTPGNYYILLEIKGGKYTRIDDPPSGFRCDGTFYHANIS